VTPVRPAPEEKSMTEERVSVIVARHRADPRAVIAVLQDVQEEFHFLPEPALRRVSRELDVPLSRILSLATFYRAFSLKPKGRHPVHICLGTACHVRGAQLVMEKFERELGIRSGETTADREFSLEAVRCVGCCGLAPVVTVGDEVHGKTSPAKVVGLIKKYRP
jgi:NADH-quinone oxidoreductase subunit E